MFGVDDVLREYADVYGRDIEEDGRIAIGYVYLTIRFTSLLHPRYTSMEFWAATSGMSRVFARSAGVREVFTDLTAAMRRSVLSVRHRRRQPRAAVLARR